MEPARRRQVTPRARRRPWRKPGSTLFRLGGARPGRRPRALRTTSTTVVMSSLIVLRGTPTLRSPEGERELQEGEVVHFPPGPEGAHQLLNRPDAVARYVTAAALPTPEIIEYPDSGKIASMARTETTGGGPLFTLNRLADGVDYFDGESAVSGVCVPVTQARLQAGNWTRGGSRASSGRGRRRAPRRPSRARSARSRGRVVLGAGEAGDRRPLCEAGRHQPVGRRRCRHQLVQPLRPVAAEAEPLGPEHRRGVVEVVDHAGDRRARPGRSRAGGASGRRRRPGPRARAAARRRGCAASR